MSVDCKLHSTSEATTEVPSPAESEFAESLTPDSCSHKRIGERTVEKFSTRWPIFDQLSGLPTQGRTMERFSTRWPLLHEQTFEVLEYNSAAQEGTGGVPGRVIERVSEKAIIIQESRLLITT